MAWRKEEGGPPLRRSVTKARGGVLPAASTTETCTVALDAAAVISRAPAASIDTPESATSFPPNRTDWT